MAESRRCSSFVFSNVFEFAKPKAFKCSYLAHLVELDSLFKARYSQPFLLPRVVFHLVLTCLIGFGGNIERMNVFTICTSQGFYISCVDVIYAES